MDINSCPRISMKEPVDLEFLILFMKPIAGNVMKKYWYILDPLQMEMVMVQLPHTISFDKGFVTVTDM
tara:strand:+ start:261 stop:464 length:204 start_codon:yes stop_codon:yes gene_type:complete